jgi:hypothetical protein
VPHFAALYSRFAAAPRLWVQMASGVEEPQGRRGRGYWVVARGLCRFFKVPLLPQATAARQRDALELQIGRLSPFAETGSHWHFGPDFISLWLWDAAAARSAGEAIGVDVDRLRALPEPVLRPPGADGVRLIETADGVEAQCWTGGAPAASRWWAASPDRQAWLLFQRGASVPPERMTPLPAVPQRLDWLASPWTQARSGGSFDLTALDPRLAAAAAAGLLLIAYGYLGAEWLHQRVELSRTEAAITAQMRQGEPQLTARTAALDNQAAIARLRELDRYPAQLALMARVAGMLPNNGQVRLADWSWDDGHLELTVAAGQPLDSLFFVRSLERVDGFRGVGVERAGSDNSLHLRLTVAPR